jgi:putative ABC transport system permease protein
MLTMLLAGLNERRREIAILRSVGARPLHVFGLLAAEAVMLTVLGALLGLALLYLSLAVAQPIVDARFGLYLSIGLPTTRDAVVLGLVVAAGFLAGAIPAYRAYRRSLADGLMIRT